MKVLFLDIDGVINTVGGELGAKYCQGRDIDEIYAKRKELGALAAHAEVFDPACLWYLREIVKDTGCKIVVSSTWRIKQTVESMKSWFKCPIIREAIIDKTPEFYGSEYDHLRDRRGRIQRGEEIKWWVDNHPEVTRYAILDDDSDMDIVMDNFFRTCSHDGLKKTVAQKVIFHLNHEELIPHYRMNNALIKFLAEARGCFDGVDSYKEVEATLISKFKMVCIDYEEHKRKKYELDSRGTKA